MTRDWRDLLVAWLHDPPDKALDIRGHESRARSYASVALGDHVSEAEQKDPSDPLAAIAERLPCPHWRALTVGVEQGQLRLRHPLSGAERVLRVTGDVEPQVRASIEELVSDIDTTENRFLLLWRLLPEVLAKGSTEWFAHLPADTRVPDHSIWRHLDITAGLKAANAGSSHNAAFLSFSLGPVQSFIGAARSVRDLWSGSMLLSWLTWRALLSIVEELGPTAVIYPSLPGTPWLDRWLRNNKQLCRVPSPSESLLRTPCFPNRFLAVVPWGLDGQQAQQLAEKCRNAALGAWREVAESVHADLDQRWRLLDSAWDCQWNAQIDSFFDIRTAVLPWQQLGSDDQLGTLLGGAGGFAAAFPDAAAVREMARAIPKDDNTRYDQEHAGRWQARVELSARLMQAIRNVRHVPSSPPATLSGEKVPPKCSLLGTLEQMGPGDRAEADAFWDKAVEFKKDGVRLRERERLCAVSLVKRFSGPCFFAKELGLTRDSLRYEDTATVAAAEWLERAGIDPWRVREDHDRWSGQWLHWARRDGDDREDDCPPEVWTRVTHARDPQNAGRPPAYYAVLMMDGDDMGGWLRGDKSPTVKEVIAPQLEHYFAKYPAARRGLDARRPLGPALHAAISEALANFALHFVPRIVEDYRGTLIYAGGDDVLALLPTSQVLECAKKLRDTFRQDWSRDNEGTERLLMGQKATISAGVAIVHYKEDLRFAMQAARSAEDAAKQAGKNALQISACRRSGEHSSAWCSWEYVDTLCELVAAFLPGPANEPGASDRWAYNLRQESATLEVLPDNAMCAEIMRLVNRSEQDTRQRLSRTNDLTAGAQIANAFKSYAAQRNAKTPAKGTTPSDDDRRDAFRDFVILCQTASFLARGRDE